MCNPPPTVDYSAEPEQITQLRNQSASARSGCCTCTFRKSGRFNSTGKLEQLKADGVTPNGHHDNPWTGEVYVASDGARGEVTVFHRLQAVNKTAPTTTYPETTPVSDAELASRVEKIPPAIERAWNARGYKLKITDVACGERTFDVKFIVRMVESGGHYVLNFVNVPGMGTVNDVMGVSSGRSYILPPDRGKFNLGDSRSATDHMGEQCLEAHEFGHMIGLIDEYRDVPMDRGGVKYVFPDRSAETAAVNGELMGSMATKTAQPNRYCVTIAYAAISVLEANGCTVTDCVIQ
jgi:hypothetical protein